jgi:UDP-glucose 4-epimerase
MKTILITGAYGFIGKYLSFYLSKLGHEIIGLGHGSWSEVQALNYGIKKWMSGDITINNLRYVCSKKQPEIIFHLAGGATVAQAEKNPDEDFFKNVTSTSELLEWMRLDLSQSRVILASSASVYGQGVRGPISEDFIGIPYSVYGKNKNKMELLCRSYKDPELKKQLLWEFCGRLIKMETPLILGGTGKELRDWTYIDDVVNILSSIGLDNRKVEKNFIVNIGTGIGSSVEQLLEIVLNKWNNKKKLYNKSDIKFSKKNRPGDPFSLIADTALLYKLGLSCKTQLNDGINYYIDWFKRLKKVAE